MGDRNWGLYRKFNVERTDGSSEPGGKHQGCEYFVLDLAHDKYAEPALRAYARHCEREYPLLARDLYAKANEICTDAAPMLCPGLKVECLQQPKGCPSACQRDALRLNAAPQGHDATQPGVMPGTRPAAAALGVLDMSLEARLQDAESDVRRLHREKMALFDELIAIHVSCMNPQEIVMNDDDPRTVKMVKEFLLKFLEYKAAMELAEGWGKKP